MRDWPDGVCLPTRPRPVGELFLGTFAADPEIWERLG